MISDTLQKARDFEAKYAPRIPDTERPVFHVTGAIGWINDPNGFSFYKGEYHLFFQYHPYSTLWGPMHWGHVKSRDLLHWERLPAALAPDTDADPDGCFSGGAVELPDGRQLLIYTGVRRIRQEDGSLQEYQTQCVAVGDGVDYEKYPGNPVIPAADIPAGNSDRDFRDPKIWREDDGTYCCVVGNRTADGSGAVLLYESDDGFHWHYAATLDACRNRYGKMWECPDFFPLDGTQVLLVSPQEMLPEGREFHAGYGSLCLLGSYDKKARHFSRERVQAIDYGIDFYAPQTLLAPDGRRIMIAWMQNWTTASSQPNGIRCFGEMTLPRELSVRDGRLVQNPIRELDACRTNRVAYENVTVTSQELILPGVQGKVADLTVTVRPAGDQLYRSFMLKLAIDGGHFTTVRYKPGENVVRVDRSRCGFPYDIVHVREFYVRPRDGVLKIRAVLDRYSVELFFNDGEQAATFVLYSELDAPTEGISFQAEGTAEIDVDKYDLVL